MTAQLTAPVRVEVDLVLTLGRGRQVTGWEYAQIGDRLYARHAVDRMKVRLWDGMESIGFHA